MTKQIKIFKKSTKDNVVKNNLIKKEKELITYLGSNNLSDAKIDKEFDNWLAKANISLAGYANLTGTKNNLRINAEIGLCRAMVINVGYHGCYGYDGYPWSLVVGHPLSTRATSCAYSSTLHSCHTQHPMERHSLRRGSGAVKNCWHGVNQVSIKLSIQLFGHSYWWEYIWLPWFALYGEGYIHTAIDWQQEGDTRTLQKSNSVLAIFTNTIGRCLMQTMSSPLLNNITCIGLESRGNGGLTE